MRKLKRSTESEKSTGKSTDSSSNMASVAIKKYDELIRCTNVLTEGIETEFLKFVKHQDKCREKWLSSEEENHVMKKDMAKYKAESDTLIVKLKHARNQLDSEMKKRLKAEQTVDHMARQLQLIKELILDKDSGNTLNTIDREKIAQSLVYKRVESKNELSNYHGAHENASYTFEESASVLSPSDYDITDDDILDETMASSRRKSQKRTRASAPILEPGETSEDTDYVKRTRVTEEEQLMQQMNKSVRKSSTQKSPRSHETYQTERLDRDFPRPPPQERRPPSKQHLKQQSSESTTDTSENTETDATETDSSVAPQSFALTRHQQRISDHPINQDAQKKMTKQTTVPNLYPNLEHLVSPDSKKKYNTLSSPRSARKDLSHNFVTKIAVRLESCEPCKKKLRFGSSIAKCQGCKATCHLECKDAVPMPCMQNKNDTPDSKKKEGMLEYYITNKSYKVPPLMRYCIDEIERRGLKETGIYRIPGMERDVRELKEKYLRGKIPDLSKKDIHVVCGCLKDFLRGLREPLVTFALHESFMCAATLADEDDSLSAMYQCVSELPQANRDSLAEVMVHLQRVAQSHETQMSVSNLSKVFGPTLVGHRSSNPSHMEMLEDIKLQPEVVTRLLEMPSDYWTQFTGSSQLKTPPFNPTFQTPTTPECKPEVFTETRLGTGKKNYCAMTPKVKSRKENRRHFFDSPS